MFDLTLQHTATHCNILQHTATQCNTIISHQICSTSVKWRALQCAAVYCSVVQCVEVCCIVLQRIEVCSNVLQCLAVCRNVLIGVITCRFTLWVKKSTLFICSTRIVTNYVSNCVTNWRNQHYSYVLREALRTKATRRQFCVNSLQVTTTHCNTLWYTAKHCNTLQYTATHCNTYQSYVSKGSWRFDLWSTLSGVVCHDSFPSAPWLIHIHPSSCSNCTLFCQGV